LRKWDREIPDLSREAFQVTTDQEWMLLKTMAQLPKVVSDSMIQHNCAPIANYALELAHVFTAFYHECPVLTADNEATLHMRLRLCEAALQTLSNALGILGIDTPERM
jgi:arginyl-tRNA synthetase